MYEQNQDLAIGRGEKSKIRGRRKTFREKPIKNPSKKIKHKRKNNQSSTFEALLLGVNHTTAPDI